jgi:hypothetical protein
MDIYGKALRARERAAAERVDAFYREWTAVTDPGS